MRGGPDRCRVSSPSEAHPSVAETTQRPTGPPDRRTTRRQTGTRETARPDLASATRCAAGGDASTWRPPSSRRARGLRVGRRSQRGSRRARVRPRVCRRAQSASCDRVGLRASPAGPRSGGRLLARSCRDLRLPVASPGRRDSKKRERPTVRPGQFATLWSVEPEQSRPSLADPTSRRAWHRAGPVRCRADVRRVRWCSTASGRARERLRHARPTAYNSARARSCGNSSQTGAARSLASRGRALRERRAQSWRLPCPRPTVHGRVARVATGNRRRREAQEALRRSKEPTP